MAGVSDDLTRLAALSTHDLRLEWRHLHRAPTSGSLSRDLLLRAVAYKHQERAHGGLSQTAKRMLAALSQNAASRGDDSLQAPAILRPGTRLAREWRGRTHAVLVLDDGFEYQSQRYGSLSEIARIITGTHWSGPRFFATRSVPKVPRKRPSPDAAANGQV